MKRIDDKPEENYLKFGVYGDPGTGKTTAGVSAPNPLILLSERQGLPHIKKAAARLERPVPPVLFMEDIEDYRNVLRALNGDKEKSFMVVDGNGEVQFRMDTWPETVVIDSLTDACRLVEEEVHLQAPLEKGKDGLPKISMRHWGTLKTRCENLIRAFRNVPLHVVFLCLEDNREIGEGSQKERQVGPQLATRSLAAMLGQSVNVIGRTLRASKIRETEDGKMETVYRFGIQTTGPEYMLTKPYKPYLEDIEKPDLSAWIEKIHASYEGGN